MLRLLGYFALTFVVFLVLVRIPFVGGLVGSVPILGFFVAAVLVSFALTRWGEAALHRRKQHALMRELGAVDNPYNKGKVGLLLLQQRRFAAAAPLLAEAAAAEPDSAEWQYRHGCALVGARRAAEAIEPLKLAVGIDDEHAYGAAMMRLAEAFLAAGDAESSIEALDRVDRNHGESAEGAYRRGLALKALGRRDEAREALSRVGHLAGKAVGYQKRSASVWSLRATVARFL
jgi:tetratricopeptide (TPR) repeat protein